MPAKISLDPRPPSLERTYIFESSPDAPSLFCLMFITKGKPNWMIIAPPGFYASAADAVLPFVCLAYTGGALESDEFHRFISCLHQGHTDLAMIIANRVGWSD